MAIEQRPPKVNVTMKLWSHHGPGVPPPPDPEPDLTPPDPGLPPLAVRLGVLVCSGRGCPEQTGLACAFIDRRDRHCPTAWCPAHRVVLHDAAYCPNHGMALGATEDAHVEHHPWDLENRVPLLVNWVSRELEGDVRTLMEGTGADYGQVVVADPVRFVLVGVDRVRTWERAWKMCSHIGVSLRVHVAVEEARPDVVIGRVNSQPVVEVPPPADDLQHRAEDPGLPPSPEVGEFRARMIAAIAAEVAEWRDRNPAPPRVDIVGEVRPPSSASATPDPEAPSAPAAA